MHCALFPAVSTSSLIIVAGEIVFIQIIGSFGSAVKP